MPTLEPDDQGVKVPSEGGRSAENGHGCDVPRCDGTRLGHLLAVDFPRETRQMDEALDSLRRSAKIAALVAIYPNGIAQGPAAIHFCPVPGCLDVWESEATCEHADLVPAKPDVCDCRDSGDPHPPHLPCDMGCQPDRHEDRCAVYLTVPRALVNSWHCTDCGHCHTVNGCIGDPTPSDLWAGVSPAACDCDATYSPGMPSNPDRGPRCGECRLGLGSHEPLDPQCAWHVKEAGRG